MHADHLGSTQAVSDESGALTQSIDYYPFGGKRIESGTDVSHREFIGENFDELSDLSYLNARYLDSSRGQFLSQDPVFWEVGISREGLGVLTNPQLQNSYSYAANNPVTQRDPTGRQSEAQQSSIQQSIKAAISKKLDSINQAFQKLLVSIAEMSPAGSAHVLMNGSHISGQPATGFDYGIAGLDLFGGALGKAAKSAKYADDVAGFLNPGIKIGEKELKHVIEKHGSASIVPESSIFNEGEDISGLIKLSTQQPMSRQFNGNYERVFDLGRTIGFDAEIGGQTTMMTVITRPNGNLVTAFPGMPRSRY
jgi:RHS repeat-associated protein